MGMLQGPRDKLMQYKVKPNKIVNIKSGKLMYIPNDNSQNYPFLYYN